MSRVCSVCEHTFALHSREGCTRCGYCGGFTPPDPRVPVADALERIATALEILAWIEGQQHGIYRSPGALAYLAARMDALEPAAPPAPPTPGGGGDA